MATENKRLTRLFSGEYAVGRKPPGGGFLLVSIGNASDRDPRATLRICPDVFPIKATGDPAGTRSRDGQNQTLPALNKDVQKRIRNLSISLRLVRRVSKVEERAS